MGKKKRVKVKKKILYKFFNFFNSNKMLDLEYYKCNNKKYLTTIDLSNLAPFKKEQDSILICLLDRSGSMDDNVAIYVNEIFPRVL